MSVLEFDHVVKHYNEGAETVRAVDSVSLAIEPGEMVTLMGPSGSGKSTLLMLAAAALTPDAGRVLYEGRDLAPLSEKEKSHYLSSNVGIVFQTHRLMPGASPVDQVAVFDILRGVGVKNAHARAVPWLERVGLGARLNHGPGRLSGGEIQRVAIARALVNEPRLILADEPTAQLDRTRSNEIFTLFRSIAHERDAAVLLVTHDPAAADIADRCYELSDGQLSLSETQDGERTASATLRHSSTAQE